MSESNWPKHACNKDKSSGYVKKLFIGICIRHLSIRLRLTILHLSIYNSITPIIEIVGIFPLFLMIHMVIEVKIMIMFIIVSIITAPPTINMVRQQIALHLEIFIPLHSITKAP